ncbi:MAG: GC-type dockerin domain-anchored protein [Planctomycetota bacterium]
MSNDGTRIGGTWAVPGTSPSVPTGGFWSESTGLVVAEPFDITFNAQFAMCADADMRSFAGYLRESETDFSDEAALWRLGSDPQLLGTLGGIHPDAYSTEPYSLALAISADGETVTGYSSSRLGVEAFVWDQQSGMHGLGSLDSSSGDLQISVAWAVHQPSGEVYGYSRTEESRQTLFRWTEEHGMEDLLPDFPFQTAQVFGASRNGSAMVGGVLDASGIQSARPFVWSRERGMNLVPLPEGLTIGAAVAASDDGGAVLGVAGVDTGMDTEFVWMDHLGSMELEDYAALILREPLGPWFIYGPMAMSADGSRIAGFAQGTCVDADAVYGYPYTCFTNFIIDLTPPCNGDWDVDDRLTFFDVYGYLTDYNTEHPAADLDRDGSIEPEDLFRFIDAFNAGCP